jgi:hypothetical protein
MIMVDKCPSCGHELPDPVDVLAGEIRDILAARGGRYHSHRELSGWLLAGRVRFCLLDLDAALERLSEQGHLIRGPKVNGKPWFGQLRVHNGRTLRGRVTYGPSGVTVERFPAPESAA